MVRYRFAFAFALIGALMAGSLYADRVTYVVGTGAKAEVKFEDKAEVTSWSASKVVFKAGGKDVTVNYVDIIAVDRNGGTMSPKLADALEAAGADPGAAVTALEDIMKTGTELDKEEAAIYRAQIIDSESAANEALIPQAIKAYSDYINGGWKAGFFAREAYRGLARLQKYSDAKATLNKMITADTVLAREGNQLLGELEASQPKPNWQDAINAFKKAQAAAGSDTNNKYLAMAWEGWCTLKNGNSAGAKTLLETVANDQNFDDPNSTIDENALAIAFRALGDLHYDAGAHKNAYNAYIKGAYYAWWTGGAHEGHCLGYAYACAKKLEGSTDADWKKRKEKLQTALAVGFPKVLTEVDKEK